MKTSVPELKTMFPVKREPPDTFNVGNDSQRIRCMDDNPHVGDILNINTSENKPDKNLSHEIMMTVAYVKNETSDTLNYDTLNYKGNEGIHERNLTDISVMKTEGKEACTDNALRDVTNHEYDTIEAKETSQHYQMKGHDINHMVVILQPNKISDDVSVDMEDVCSSSATQAKAKTQKCTHKTLHSGERRFICDLCGYLASKLSDLKRQKLVHPGEKPHKCDICDYSTTQSGNLKTHKLIHSGEKPRKCDVCDYSTTHSGALKRHKLIHSGKKPYKCDLCDFSTTQSGHLKTHKMIHLGEKPYTCDQCDFSTTQSWNLKTHKLIHTGEKPYKCNLCDYSSTNSGNLKRHKLRH